MNHEPNLMTKLHWNMPWLVRYPFARAARMLSHNLFEKKHVVFTVANHFEPSWSDSGHVGIDEQRRRMEMWSRAARATGGSLVDADGTPFRHTYFYPGEQYDATILEMLAGMQSEGLGETEIHLHHGVDTPDTAENLRRSLVEFRDTLAERHNLLSSFGNDDTPRYAFVHGNLALANSCGGRFCGVDEEMQILADTGCYADMTLPSAPSQGQVSVINQIYECALPLHERAPHRIGKRIEVGGRQPALPMIVTGPLVFNWRRMIKGIPVPRIDDGALTRNQAMDLARFSRWLRADVTVAGKSDWVFVKLYCHGFFDGDLPICIGEEAKRFFSEVIEQGERTGKYSVHFASAREVANMVWAAVDGKSGAPGSYRDYRLRSRMLGAGAKAKSKAGQES